MTRIQKAAVLRSSIDGEQNLDEDGAKNGGIQIQDGAKAEGVKSDVLSPRSDLKGSKANLEEPKIPASKEIIGGEDTRKGKSAESLDYGEAGEFQDELDEANMVYWDILQGLCNLMELKSDPKDVNKKLLAIQNDYHARPNREKNMGIYYYYYLRLNNYRLLCEVE